MSEGTDTSLKRMLRVLDVIEDGPLVVGVDVLHAALGFSRSTLYRYLKILTDAGLLSALPDLGYTLGPRITELDYKMRTRDPLVIAARPVMAELVRVVPGVALLCRRYRTRVLCVHQERAGAGFESRYERGRARPLLRGAASLAILAGMPAAAVARLYEHEATAFDEAGLGATLPRVRARLRAIRQAGWCMSEGQVTPGVTGIAAPVTDNRGDCVGSLSLTLGRQGVAPEEVDRIAERVVFCAGIVSQAIARS